MSTIADTLDAFLAEQHHRLAERTYHRYADIIDLFRTCMEGYGPNSLDDTELAQWRAASDDDPDAFAHLFGPEKIPGELGEFFAWFLPRKVAGGIEMTKTARTVVKKLAVWLEANGHIPHTAVLDMTEQANDAVEAEAADDNDYLDDFLYDLD